MKKLVLLLVVTVIIGTGSYLNAQSSIAHVNTQTVLDTMPSRQAAVKEQERFEKRAMEELQETQLELQQAYNKLQEEKATMAPTAFKFEENRLRKKSQEFQERQQELDQQVQILSQELNAPVLERVQKAIEIVAEREKVDYVIDETALLYGNGKNITDKVIVEVLKMENESLVGE